MSDVKTAEGPIYRVPGLDEMIDSDRCARWLGVTKRTLLSKCRGRRAAIPAFWVNQRTPRFHPRTVIAKLAADSGVRPEVIAASLNEKQSQ